MIVQGILLAVLRVLFWGIDWYHRYVFWSRLLKDISHCLLVRCGRVIDRFQNKARSILKTNVLDTWSCRGFEECFHSGETVHPGPEILRNRSIRERMTLFVLH